MSKLNVNVVDAQTENEMPKIKIEINKISCQKETSTYTASQLKALQSTFFNSYIDPMVKQGTDKPLILEDMKFNLQELNWTLEIVNNNSTIPDSFDPTNIMSIFTVLDGLASDAIPCEKFEQYYSSLSDETKETYNGEWSKPELNGHNRV